MREIPRNRIFCQLKIPKQNENLSKTHLIKVAKQKHAISLTKGTNDPSLIKDYISHGFHKEALLIYTQCRAVRTVHHAVLPVLLKACASLALLFHGKTFHSESIKIGVDSDVMIGTALVSMYSKCSEIVDARKVFDDMPERNVVTWNAMIGGYSKNGDMVSAESLFQQMSVRTAVTWTEMIDGFARIGDTVAARHLFDHTPRDMRCVVTWTVMVDGYASNGEMELARTVFEQMPHRNFFSWSSMIAGYCKKGDVKEARMIFDQIPVRNLVNWNALIAGYAQNGFCKEALEAFEKMRVAGFDPDEVTVVSVLSACAQLGSLEAGKEVHELINRSSIKLNQFVLNGLVDMFAKCGDIGNARIIFEGMIQKNDVCWNAMISGLAIHGQSEEAIKLFTRMESSKVMPNNITFLAILSACAHGGFVKEGLDIFTKMTEKYALVPAIGHYGCLVDLLGRAGRVSEAYDLVKKMPMKPNDAVWGALLGACRIHMDIEMAERVVKEVGMPDSNMNLRDDARYVLVSNLYAASDRWEEAEKMRRKMAMNWVPKTPGYSSIMAENIENLFHPGSCAQ